MPSRRRHYVSHLLDRDILHVGGVTLAACVLSAGLLYAGYFVHTFRVARNAPCTPRDGRCLLLFGKHAPGGMIDGDFDARIRRVGALWHSHAPQRVLLLGGGPADGPSEAEVARAALLADLPHAAPALHLESASRNTLQNLRNAREMLREAAHEGSVVLLSSRYHLARCSVFARQLGLQAEVCAAEERLRWTPRNLWRIAGEAGYLCLLGVGTRWARLIRSQRMLDRIR